MLPEKFSTFRYTEFLICDGALHRIMVSLFSILGRENMNFTSLGISALTSIPSFCLCIYVFHKDKVEKEPFHLLAMLFAAGAVMYFPASYVERFIGIQLSSVFSSEISYSLSGVAVYSSSSVRLLYYGIVSFAGVAIVEEGLKWLAMYLITHKSRHFDCLFDGVIYGVFTAFGYAVMENLSYAWDGGWDTLLLRMLASLPGHICFGVIMGCFYTLWRLHYLLKQMEKRYAQEIGITVTEPFRSGGWMMLSIFASVLLHGVYCCMNLLSADGATVVFVAFMAMLFVICLYTIQKLSCSDEYNEDIIERCIRQKYPQILMDQKKNKKDEGGL